MNLPGLVSNCLLTVRGSQEAVCNRTSTINEMMSALGRKRRQPSRLGACMRRIGKFLESEDSDGIHEMPSAMTFDLVSRRPK